MIGNIMIDSISEVFWKIPAWFTLANCIRCNLHDFFDPFINVIRHGLYSFVYLMLTQKSADAVAFRWIDWLYYDSLNLKRRKNDYYTKKQNGRHEVL